MKAGKLLRRQAAAALVGTLIVAGSGAALSVAHADPRPADPTADPTLRNGVSGWLFDDSQTTVAQGKTAIGSDLAARLGYTGKGIGVALVDTGVVPVKGLTSGNVVDGADLSFESQGPGLAHLDTFGHGTHMAGIIAGTDSGNGGFQGVAPDAELTSVKVATSNGAVDVSQVIAGIDWVVAHRNDDPQHPVRVLNLSYGTTGVQNYQVDPLTHAVENAWRAGIVVVVAAGNNGATTDALNDPAYDPYVLTVGAADLNGTTPAADDTVTAFSSAGTASRGVDVVAPGRSIVSLVDPGSYLSTQFPSASEGKRYFKGSGTSQAAAFVSGAVAQLLQARPDLTPDQVKAQLERTATPLPLADASARGAGEVNVLAATLAPVPAAASVVQDYPQSQGTGSLEAARGSLHVAMDGVVLSGERDIFGPWDAASWAAASRNGTAWDGGTWNGVTWTGDCWCSTSWLGSSWSGSSWSGSSWSGSSWSGSSWSGSSWSGSSWSGSSWSGSSWSGSSWSGSSWSGSSWSGSSWSGSSWSGGNWA